MKKFLLLMAVLTLVSGVASANSIFETCAFPQLTFTGGGGAAQTITCTLPIGIPSGWTFTSAEEYFTADYTGGAGSGTNTVTTSFTNFGTGLAAFGAISNPECTTTGGASSNNTSNCNGNYTLTPGGLSALQDLAAGGAAAATLAGGASFTVSVSDAVTSGAVTDGSAGVILEFDYTQNSTTPEPMTMMLVGGGLLGLGLAVSKRRKKA
jgi:hypothetical protein